MKKKYVAILAVVVAAVLILGAFTAAALVQNRENDYAAKISLGQKYLRAGDYDNAIVAFRAAVSLNRGRAEGYTGLYKAYMGAGDRELAYSTLEAGIRLTNSISLELLREQEFPNGLGEVPQTSDAAGITFTPPSPAGIGLAEEKTVRPVLNRDFLNFAGAANFGDYQAKYGTLQPEITDGVYIYRILGMGVQLRYHDTDSQRVIDQSGNRPYANFFPNEIILEDVSYLFGGASEIAYQDLESLPGVVDLKRSGDTVTFSAGGCKISIACDGGGAIHSGAVNSVVPQGTNAVQDVHTVTGIVVDAVSGNPVAGVKVCFYAGTYKSGGGTEVKTDSNGKYQVEVDGSGSFLAEVTQEGYITEQFSLYIPSGTTAAYQDFAISPQLAAGEIRIVLTWGASPTDLDSYLTGTTDDGRSVRVSFMSKKAERSGGGKIAELDVDDLNGYGPETTTIYDINGVYDFVVADFTESGTLSASGAEVKIYQGSSLVQTITVCGGLENGWAVCRIDHGTVTVQNTGCETDGGVPQGW